MKHILIYIVVGILLLSVVTAYGNADRNKNDMVAAVAAADNTAVLSSKVGVLLNSVSTLEEVNFRTAFKEGLPEGCDVHFSDASGNPETQLAMLRKMLSDGYRVIFIELIDGSDVDQFIELAMLKQVPLVFMGEEPAQEQLNKWDMLYYIGFTDSDAYESMAEAISRAFSGNVALMDKNRDGKLVYSVLSTSKYTASSKNAVMSRVFSDHNLKLELSTDAVKESFEYSMYKTLRSIAKTDTELLVCESSNDAYLAWQYYHDTDAFDEAPAIEFAVLALDDGSEKMITEGSAVIAVGRDGKAMGEIGAKLCSMLMAGETPTAEALGVAMDGRCIRFDNTMLFSDVVTHPVYDPNVQGE